MTFEQPNAPLFLTTLGKNRELVHRFIYFQSAFAPTNAKQRLLNGLMKTPTIVCKGFAIK